MQIKMLIADDHKIVREAIASLLNNEPGMEVVGEAGDGRTAVQLARELQPSVVVMDITMPNLNGVEAARQIVSRTARRQSNSLIKSQLMKKLGVQSIAELVKYAISEGLTCAYA